MFDKLFSFIRQGVKNAILGGVQDDQDELTVKVEARDLSPLRTQQKRMGIRMAS